MKNEDIEKKLAEFDEIVEIVMRGRADVGCGECRSLREQVDALQQLRPLWAQGYSSDSVAAQASAGALSEIWKALGVDNQTDAMQKLRKTKKGLPQGIGSGTVDFRQTIDQDLDDRVQEAAKRAGLRPVTVEPDSEAYIVNQVKHFAISLNRMAEQARQRGIVVDFDIRHINSCGRGASDEITVKLTRPL